MNQIEFQANQALENSGAIRKNFLQAEINTARLALDFAMLQLRLGYVDVAWQEVKAVEVACQTVLRFLPEVNDTYARKSFRDDLVQIAEALEDLKQKLS